MAKKNRKSKKEDFTSSYRSLFLPDAWVVDKKSHGLLSVCPRQERKENKKL
jgi:hypothetical protein